MKHRVFPIHIRMIATLALTVFLCQEIAAAAPSLPSVQGTFTERPHLDFRIPPSVAFLEDHYDPKGAEKMIYLLQDAHTNESGQLNLAKALELTLKRHRMKYVFLEAGEGNVSLSFLRGKATLAARKRVAGSYLRKGLLQGSEYLDLVSDVPFILWGVEDQTLYENTIMTYDEVAKSRTRFLNYISKIESTLQALKPHVYHPELMGLDRMRESYLADKISVTEYFDILTHQSEKLNIPLKAFPHLGQLQKIRSLENGIDFERANAEQVEVLELFDDRDRQNLLDASKVNHSPFKYSNHMNENSHAFYALLEEKLNESANKRYSELTKYFTYLKQVRMLNVSNLLEDQNKLEDAVFEGLQTDPDAKELFEISNTVRQYRKFLNLSSTPDEFQTYLQKRDRYDIAYVVGFLNRKIMDLKRLTEKVIFLDDGFKPALQKITSFYKLTLKRDEVFVRRMLEKMDNASEDRAVLIAGGYHTPNLKALLRRKNIAYAVITPQVLHETNMDRYEKLLLSQIQKSGGTTAAAKGQLGSSDMLALRKVSIRPLVTGARAEIQAGQRGVRWQTSLRLAGDIDPGARLEMADRILNVTPPAPAGVRVDDWTREIFRKIDLLRQRITDLEQMAREHNNTFLAEMLKKQRASLSSVHSRNFIQIRQLLSRMTMLHGEMLEHTRNDAALRESMEPIFEDTNGILELFPKKRGSLKTLNDVVTRANLLFRASTQIVYFGIAHSLAAIAAFENGLLRAGFVLMFTAGGLYYFMTKYFLDAQALLSVDMEQIDALQDHDKGVAGDSGRTTQGSRAREANEKIDAEIEILLRQLRSAVYEAEQGGPRYAVWAGLPRMVRRLRGYRSWPTREIKETMESLKEELDEVFERVRGHKDDASKIANLIASADHVIRSMPQNLHHRRVLDEIRPQAHSLRRWVQVTLGMGGLSFGASAAFHAAGFGAIAMAISQWTFVSVFVIAALEIKRNHLLDTKLGPRGRIHGTRISLLSRLENSDNPNFPFPLIAETLKKRRIWTNPGIQNVSPTSNHLSKMNFERAERRIQSYVKKTPLIYAKRLSQLSGRQVYIKDESRQVGGSFKSRGVYNEVYVEIEDIVSNALDGDVQSRQILRDGVELITQTDGNHGIALVYAVTHAVRHIADLIQLMMDTGVYDKDAELIADIRKIKPIVYTIERLHREKAIVLRDALEAHTALFGERSAAVELYDRYEDAANARKIYVRAQNSHYANPERGRVRYMDHGGPNILKGHGTAGIEIAEDLLAMGITEDQHVAVFVPVGAGGPLGVIGAFNQFWPNATGLMVQSDPDDAFFRTLKANRRGHIRMKKNNKNRKPTIVIPDENNEPFELVFPDGIVVDQPENYWTVEVAQSIAHAIRVDDRMALELSGPIMFADLKDYYAALPYMRPGMSEDIQARLGGTTALTAEALRYIDHIPALNDPANKAEVVVLFATEGNMPFAVTKYLDDRYDLANGGSLMKRYAQSFPETVYLAGSRTSVIDKTYAEPVGHEEIQIRGFMTKGHTRKALPERTPKRQFYTNETGDPLDGFLDIEIMHQGKQIGDIHANLQLDAHEKIQRIYDVDFFLDLEWQHRNIMTEAWRQMGRLLKVTGTLEVPLRDAETELFLIEHAATILKNQLEEQGQPIAMMSQEIQMVDQLVDLAKFYAYHLPQADRPRKPILEGREKSALSRFRSEITKSYPGGLSWKRFIRNDITSRDHPLNHSASFEHLHSWLINSYDFLNEIEMFPPQFLRTNSQGALMLSAGADPWSFETTILKYQPDPAVEEGAAELVFKATKTAVGVVGPDPKATITHHLNDRDVILNTLAGRGIDHDHAVLLLDAIEHSELRSPVTLVKLTKAQSGFPAMVAGFTTYDWRRDKTTHGQNTPVKFSLFRKGNNELIRIPFRIDPFTLDTLELGSPLKFDYELYEFKGQDGQDQFRLVLVNGRSELRIFKLFDAGNPDQAEALSLQPLTGAKDDIWLVNPHSRFPFFEVRIINKRQTVIVQDADEISRYIDLETGREVDASPAAGTRARFGRVGSFFDVFKIMLHNEADRAILNRLLDADLSDTTELEKFHSETQGRVYIAKSELSGNPLEGRSVYYDLEEPIQRKGVTATTIKFNGRRLRRDPRGSVLAYLPETTSGRLPLTVEVTQEGKYKAEALKPQPAGGMYRDGEDSADHRFDMKLRLNATKSEHVTFDVPVATTKEDGQFESRLLGGIITALSGRDMRFGFSGEDLVTYDVGTGLTSAIDESLILPLIGRAIRALRDDYGMFHNRLTLDKIGIRHLVFDTDGRVVNGEIVIRDQGTIEDLVPDIMAEQSLWDLLSFVNDLNAGSPLGEEKGPVWTNRIRLLFDGYFGSGQYTDAMVEEMFLSRQVLTRLVGLLGQRESGFEVSPAEFFPALMQRLRQLPQEPQNTSPPAGAKAAPSDFVNAVERDIRSFIDTGGYRDEDKYFDYLTQLEHQAQKQASWLDVSDLTARLEAFSSELDSDPGDPARNDKIVFVNRALSMVITGSFAIHYDNIKKQGLIFEMQTFPYVDRGYGFFIGPLIRQELIPKIHLAPDEKIVLNDVGVSTGAMIPYLVNAIGSDARNMDYHAYDIIFDGNLLSTHYRGEPIEGIFDLNGNLIWFRERAGNGYSTVNLEKLSPHERLLVDSKIAALRAAYRSQNDDVRVIPFKRAVDNFFTDAERVLGTEIHRHGHDVRQGLPHDSPKAHITVAGNMYLHIPRDQRVDTVLKLAQGTQDGGFIVFLSSGRNLHKDGLTKQYRSSIQVQVYQRQKEYLVLFKNHAIQEEIARLQEIDVLTDPGYRRFSALEGTAGDIAIYDRLGIRPGFNNLPRWDIGDKIPINRTLGELVTDGYIDPFLPDDNDFYDQIQAYLEHDLEAAAEMRGKQSFNRIRNDILKVIVYFEGPELTHIRNGRHGKTYQEILNVRLDETEVLARKANETPLYEALESSMRARVALMNGMPIGKLKQIDKKQKGRRGGQKKIADHMKAIERAATKEQVLEETTRMVDKIDLPNKDTKQHIIHSLATLFNTVRAQAFGSRSDSKNKTSARLVGEPAAFSSRVSAFIVSLWLVLGTAAFASEPVLPIQIQDMHVAEYRLSLVENESGLRAVDMQDEANDVVVRNLRKNALNSRRGNLGRERANVSLDDRALANTLFGEMKGGRLEADQILPREHLHSDTRMNILINMDIFTQSSSMEKFRSDIWSLTLDAWKLHKRSPQTRFVIGNLKALPSDEHRDHVLKIIELSKLLLTRFDEDATTTEKNWFEFSSEDEGLLQETQFRLGVEKLSPDVIAEFYGIFAVAKASVSALEPILENGGGAAAIDQNESEAAALIPESIPHYVGKRAGQDAPTRSDYLKLIRGKSKTLFHKYLQKSLKPVIDWAMEHYKMALKLLESSA